MRLLTRSFLTVSVVALAAVVAWPQSLAEIAAREKARQEKERRKAGGPAKVITEDDLRGRGAGTYSQPGTGTAASPGASPSPAASPGAEKPKTEEELRAEAEKAWREKLQHFQTEVTRLEGVVASLQTDLGDLSGPLYGGSRTALLNRMEGAQKSLAAAKQQVADIEEEGRRNRYR
jgi:hypothetical protein